MSEKKNNKNKRKLKRMRKDLIVDQNLEVVAGGIVGYLMKNQDFLIKEIGINKKKSLSDQ